MKLGGYAGRFLRVNLSEEKIWKEPLSEDFARKYLGGLGFGYRFLWDMVKPGLNAFRPENPLMFLLGPFNGILAGKVAVVFKSPATEGVGVALAGGNFQAELKFAGYDGLIVTGSARKPVYLYIKDEDVEIRNATHLWGKTTHETEEIIRSELRDRRIRVASIGIAGENRVYFAAIVCDRGRAAARMGAGAVMGSKNLKAIAVKGSQGVSIANLEVFNKLFNEAVKRVDYNWWRYGSLHHTARASYWLGNYPYRNWQEESDPKLLRNCDAPSFELKHIIRRKSCFNCPVNCGSIAVVRSGKYACVTEGPEYEHVAFFSGSVDVHDSDVIIYATLKCDELGLDAISTGSVLAFAMELFQRGILNKNETDGLELRWGNGDLLIELIEKIAYRRGKFGNLLAYGSKRMAEKIGKGAEYYAIQCKGTEVGAHGVRSGRDWIKPLTFATGLRGGNHNEESTPREQNRLAIINSLVLCLFSHLAIRYELLSFLNTITGWNMSKEEFNRIGERIINVGKAFMVREGFRREHDTLPERFFKEPLPSGPAKGSIVDKEKFKRELDEYYRIRGWDVKTGIPTSKKLKELELGDIDMELEKYRR